MNVYRDKHVIFNDGFLVGEACCVLRRLEKYTTKSIGVSGCVCFGDDTCIVYRFDMDETPMCAGVWRDSGDATTGARIHANGV